MSVNHKNLFDWIFLKWWIFDIRIFTFVLSRFNVLCRFERIYTQWYEFFMPLTGLDVIIGNIVYLACRKILLDRWFWCSLLYKLDVDASTIQFTSNAYILHFDCNISTRSNKTNNVWSPSIVFLYIYRLRFVFGAFLTILEQASTDTHDVVSYGLSPICLEYIIIFCFLCFLCPGLVGVWMLMAG